jgi:hypothetical protein
MRGFEYRKIQQKGRVNFPFLPLPIILATTLFISKLSVSLDLSMDKSETTLKNGRPDALDAK